MRVALLAQLFGLTDGEKKNAPDRPDHIVRVADGMRFNRGSDGLYRAVEGQEFLPLVRSREIINGQNATGYTISSQEVPDHHGGSIASRFNFIRDGHAV